MAARGPSMMEQVQAVKDRNPGCLVFFRLGDFYELFGDDAREASRLLGITLTARTSGEGRSVRVPMAGVPHHAAAQYLRRLLEAGKRVAVCEQMEDPAAAKGPVRREVVRILTPGTALGEGFLDERSSRYAAALARVRGAVGLAWADNATGEFGAQELDDAPAALEDALQRLGPSEIIVPAGFDPGPLKEVLGAGPAVVCEEDAWTFDPAEASRRLKKRFAVVALEGLGVADGGAVAAAAGALLAYLERTQVSALAHLGDLRIHRIGEFLALDAAALRDLELVRGLEDGSPRNTLFGVLDHCAGPAGARVLKRWLQAPLADLGAIAARLDAVEALAGGRPLLEGLRAVLARAADLERIVAKAGCRAAGPRDLAGVRQTLRLLPDLERLLGPRAGLLEAPRRGDLGPLLEALEAALVDDPPAALRDGGAFRPGHDAELDGAVSDGSGAREDVLAIQEAERGRSGNPKLKVQCNNILGYFIEVSRAQASTVPADYQRKQTLVGAERYTTPALRALEARVAGSEARRRARETELFEALLARVLERARGLGALGARLAELDALASLASAAVKEGWSRPSLDDSCSLDIRGGRHPVLEPLLRSKGETFVPNDCRLDSGDAQILLITGPNMAGKSTFMRQTALIVLLAQCGSFVPAASARIGLVDRIFTRVGASDRLSRGMSTFLVEMSETANILRNATRRSLVIFDEVGRGTSTFDGVGIAWAVVEHLHNAPSLGCRTLFATHYFELAQLEALLPRVRNFSVAVREWEGRIVFLHSIRPGATDKSYGVAVARLAGMPEPVLKKALEVLEALVAGHGPMGSPPPAPGTAPATPAPDLGRALAARLLALDPDRLTPLDALKELHALRAEARDVPKGGSQERGS